MQKKVSKKFYVYPRTPGGKLYARVRDPNTGKLLTPKSTKSTDRVEAERIAMRWYLDGIPTGRSDETMPTVRAGDFERVFIGLKEMNINADEATRIVGLLKRRGLIHDATVEGSQSPDLVPWLMDMWDWEKSPYIREKQAHGQQISHRRCLDAVGAIRKHWEPSFNGMHLHEVTKNDLRDFSMKLFDSGLSAGSVNKIMTAGAVPLRWATANDVIDTDPTRGLKKFSGKTRKRGILSESEAAKILSLPWDDERSRVGNFLASEMGLRAGEILGLRVQDLGPGKLHVRNAWSVTNGLKGTKTEKERHLLWARGVREELVRLANRNPHGSGPGMFVFWSTLPDRPMDHHVLLDGLKEQFIRLKAGKNATKEERQKAEEQRQERNIVVHSWRHYTAAQLRAHSVPLNLSMEYMGHNSQEVFDAYADHKTEIGDKILADSMGWGNKAQ